MVSLQAWVSEHKVASVGAAFASAGGASLAYARRSAAAPFSPGAKPFYTRRPARVLALAMLSCAAVKQYYAITDSVLEPDADAPAAVPEGFFDPVADW
ncbi:hypothetical protein Taro_019880 [Colocasia esculenta]|uniref:Uncharacterized protein n=1 Tax=Colocasia esculenta TaxID=4460 RepID=A0A843V0N2_COLES|nr:hypothetical protein [Colocasia esculenta]